MLYFLIYNSGLELLNSLPKKLLNHSTIKNDAKRRKKSKDNILLDLTVHQSALSDKIRFNRGRPDIVHQCILQYLFSRLISSKNNKSSFQSKLIIHSINNSYFEVPHSWKPPTHFFRFRGLIENLLIKKSLKVGDKEFIYLKEGSIKKILDEINFKRILVFTSHGHVTNLKSISNQIKNYANDEVITICLVGGFQHGGIPDVITNLLKNVTHFRNVTLSGGRLPSWKIINDLLSVIEYG